MSKFKRIAETLRVAFEVDASLDDAFDTDDMGAIEAGTSHTVVKLGGKDGLDVGAIPDGETNPPIAGAKCGLADAEGKIVAVSTDVRTTLALRS